MVRPLAAVAKTIGADHTRGGKPCQDEVGYIQVGDRVAIAVSDGHGSSRYADVGSRLAVSSTLYSLTLFAEQFGSRPLEDLHRVARDVLRKNVQRAWTDAVRAHGSGDTSDLRAHGATLAFAIAIPQALVVGLVGDCDILITGRDGTVSRPVKAREYVGEQTSSLCLPEGEIDFDTAVLPPPAAESLLILSTDGYSKSFATDTDFEMIGPSYLGMIRDSGVEAVATKLESFLAQTTAKGSGDDVSIAMLYWPPGAGVEPDSNLPARAESAAAPVGAESNPPEAVAAEVGVRLVETATNQASTAATAPGLAGMESTPGGAPAAESSLRSVEESPTHSPMSAGLLSNGETYDRNEPGHAPKGSVEEGNL
jgi:serine/threonine protein phosphatase PrpC